MTTVSDLWDAYEQTQGRWSGCNWPTQVGTLGMDLNGVSAKQANRTASRWRDLAGDEELTPDPTAPEQADLADMAWRLRLRGVVVCLSDGAWSGMGVPVLSAQHCAATLAKEWEVAAYFLTEIEADARWAEQTAWDAVRAAEQGDWSRARRHARQAETIESGYHAPRGWRRLRALVERIADRSENLF